MCVKGRKHLLLVFVRSARRRILQKAANGPTTLASGRQSLPRLGADAAECSPSPTKSAHKKADFDHCRAAKTSTATPTALSGSASHARDIGVHRHPPRQRHQVRKGSRASHSVSGNTVSASPRPRKHSRTDDDVAQHDLLQALGCDTPTSTLSPHPAAARGCASRRRSAFFERNCSRKPRARSPFTIPKYRLRVGLSGLSTVRAR